MAVGNVTDNGAPPTWPERLIALIGRTMAWLTVLMVLLTFGIVLLRYGFNLGWVGLQESVTYLHAAIFMLTAAWALQTDDHVRVDIFYRGFTPRHKAVVNVLGSLFLLLPFCLLLLTYGWPYVETAWRVREGSREAGGLPLVYLLKSLILVLPLLLVVQAGNGAVRAVRDLRRPLARGGPMA